jgi:hypothetical protein
MIHEVTTKPYSLADVLRIQEMSRPRETHYKSKAYFESLMKRIFIEIRPHYKREIKAFAELQEVLKKIHALLDKELPMIVDGEKTVSDLHDAYFMKRRDCDIGVFVYMEAIRMLGLKNVDAYYGHRYGHGYLILDYYGKKYRYETTTGEFREILEEDDIVKPEELESLMKFATYTRLNSDGSPEARKVLEAIISGKHHFEADLSYAIYLAKDNYGLASQYFIEAYRKSNKKPRIGILWANYELKYGDPQKVLELLQWARIPNKISDNNAKFMTTNLKVIRSQAYLSIAKSPLLMRQIIIQTNRLLEWIRKSQKVY